MLICLYVYAYINICRNVIQVLSREQQQTPGISIGNESTTMPLVNAALLAQRKGRGEGGATAACLGTTPLATSRSCIIGTLEMELLLSCYECFSHGNSIEDNF